jgi:hypothetical protein
MTETLVVTAVALCCLLAGGLLTVPPTLVASAPEGLRLPEKGRVWLTVSFTVAVMFGLSVGGLLVDSWGLFDVLILSAMTGCVGLIVLGLTRHVGMTHAAAALLGVGAGMLLTAAAAAMPVAFFVVLGATGRDSLGKVPAATNLGHIFVVLGALLAPYLVRASVTKFGFRSGLQALALTAVVPALCVFFAGRANFPGPRDEVSLSLLLGDPRFWVAALAALFIFAVEVSALQWATRYLNEIGYSPRRQFAMLVAFWGVFLGARLFCTILEGHLAFIWVLLIAAVLSGVVLGNMVGFTTRSGGSASFLLLAACLGPLFPTLAGLVFLTFPGQPATAFGLVCALGASGRLAAEPLMRREVARDQVRVAMGITMVLVLAVAIPALLLLVLPT